LIPSIPQTLDEIAVRAAVVYALVECEELPAVVLEVVGMPCRGLFLDLQKELDKT
jgi:hypothetical protein